MRSRLRFAIALSLAAVLGGFLLYTSLGGAMETYTSPTTLQSLTAEELQGETYRLNGEVAGRVPADVAAQARSAAGYRFVVADKDDPSSTITVVYRGEIPDQFVDGREVVVTGTVNKNGVFIAKPDTLLAKCPSKFEAADSAPRSN